MHSQTIPASPQRFEDGAHYRIEIPSVEGPECLRAVLEAADRWGVPIARVSQGSGVAMLTDSELDEMAALASTAGIELSLFARPTASWGHGAAPRASAGGVFAGAVHGESQMSACIADINRASDHGIRSVLVSDIGLLAAASQLRREGGLPADMKFKTSVMLPVANAMAAATVVGLGADSINVQTDLGLAELAEIREVVQVPLDMYIESPDAIGGFVRHHEAPEMIRVASPMYIKFGLRNAPDIYPSGQHLAGVAIAQSVERVRRARLALEMIQRSDQSLQGPEISSRQPV